MFIARLMNNPQYFNYVFIIISIIIKKLVNVLTFNCELFISPLRRPFANVSHNNKLFGAINKGKLFYLCGTRFPLAFCYAFFMQNSFN